MLKDYLKRLIRSRGLDEEEMAEAMGYIMDGQVPPVQIAAFLTALRIKGETVGEITGAARAMRQRMTPVPIECDPLMDVCGTGGDGSGTFNISTAVAVVLAACDVPVAKHGNRAVSSRSGSADVLAELGVNIEAPPATMVRCVTEVGVGFLFAPTLHPAMRHAAPIRRELAVRTIFNVLGPLTNPASTKRQLMGVFDRNLVRPLAEVLGRLGSERAWVVHGDDGLDELTVCGVTHVAEWDGTEVKERLVSPQDVGLPVSPPEGLRGGTPSENASIMEELLAGKRPGAIADAVVLNTGAALVVAGSAASLAEGVQRAQSVLQSGKPAETLARLIETSRGIGSTAGVG